MTYFKGATSERVFGIVLNGIISNLRRAVIQRCRNISPTILLENNASEKYLEFIEKIFQADFLFDAKNLENVFYSELSSCNIHTARARTRASHFYINILAHSIDILSLVTVLKMRFLQHYII